MVDIRLVHSLLVAAEEQPYGFLQVQGVQLAHEVALMAAAGLVETSIGSGNSGTSAVISRVTEQGQVFLRAFKNHPLPEIQNKEAFVVAGVD